MATITHTVNRDARIAAGVDLGAGACGHLDVGVYGGYTYESWLAFTGESWAGIPNAASITSAVLKIYASGQYHIARSAGTMRVYRTSVLGTYFTEGTASHPMLASNSITGTNDPAVTATDGATGSISDADGWKSITITNIIKAYYGQSNYALQLHANSGVYEFAAREAGASYDAYIVITYNPNSLPTAATLNSPIGGATVSSQTPTLNFTPHDPDGDAHTKYTYQVDSDAAFGSPNDSIEVVGSLTNNVAVNRVVVATLPRGVTYYWRVKTADATNGYGAWSANGAFFVANAVPTVSVVYPASGVVAPLWYDGGSDTTPKVQASWNFTDTDGHAQTQCIVRIYADAAGAKSTLLSTMTLTQSTKTANLTYAVANLSYYWISFQATCSAGLQSTESTAVRHRVCWSRASYYYNIGATPPVGWGTPVVNATGWKVVTEWAASSGSTVEPTNWYTALSQVPLPTSGTANYVWYRCTLMGYSGTGTPTKPTVTDVTPKWVVTTHTADNWQYASPFVLDWSDQKYGTVSLKGTCSASTMYAAYQIVPVLPDTDYILSGYIKSQGNSQSLVRVDEESGVGGVATASLIAATQEFTRQATPVFNSGSRTKVRITCRIGGATGTFAWFDALKLEASSVVTPWTPGFIGEGVTLDSGGIQVDANAGGVFRLRGSGGGVGDTVELDAHGLLFGGDVVLYRYAGNTLATDDQFRVISTSGLVVVQATGSVIRGFDQNTDAQPFFNFTWDGTYAGFSLGAGGSTAVDTNLYRSAPDVLKTDDALYAAGNIAGTRYLVSSGVTLVAANTWYKHTGLSATLTINAEYTGQKFLICWTGSMQYPTANTNLLLAVRVDNDTSGTLNTWVAIQQQDSGAANTYHSFGGARLFIAAAGDVGATRYLYFYAQADAAASTVLTFYYSQPYASNISSIALP